MSAKLKQTLDSVTGILRFWFNARIQACAKNKLVLGLCRVITTGAADANLAQQQHPHRDQKRVLTRLRNSASGASLLLLGALLCQVLGVRVGSGSGKGQGFYSPARWCIRCGCMNSGGSGEFRSSDCPANCHAAHVGYALANWTDSDIGLCPGLSTGCCGFGDSCHQLARARQLLLTSSQRQLQHLTGRVLRMKVCT